MGALDEKRCVIVCAGERDKKPFLRKPGDFVICCDDGLTAAREIGLRPDMIVGDFDSLPPGEALPEGVETLRFPVMKDDTDSMIAVREGLSRGYREFVLLYALGGRLDHTFANIQTLAFLLDHGADGVLLGPDDWVGILRNGKRRIPRDDTYTLSVFAYGGTARGVGIEGALYPLRDAALDCSFPIGLGNRITADEAVVSVREGTLILMGSRLQGQ